MQSGGQGATFEIPDTMGTRIWIGPLHSHSAVRLDSRYRGVLKVDRYQPGCFAISDRPWVSVQGLHEEVDLFGLSDQEVSHVIEHCNATMNPEAVAVAARMAKGCAAVLPTEEVKAALFGGAGDSRMVGTMRKGSTRPFPVRAWGLVVVERSPNLQAQGVRKGAAVISVCGVPVSEVEEGGATLCCSSPVGDHIEAVIVEDGKSRTITAPWSGPRPKVADLQSQPTAGCGA
jgi:hypothetical protein